MGARDDAEVREVIAAAELRHLLGTVLGAHVGRSALAAQATADDAARAARWLTEAEQLGLPGFGVGMLLKDLSRIGAADANAAPDSASDPETAPGPISAVDALGLPGPLALACAVRRAEAGIRAHGIGLIGIRRVGALGVLGLAARDLAWTGAVALLGAQAPAIVAPWGSTRPAIGTNPLAIAAPRADAAPLVADFATSPLTLAALRERAAAGEQLPAGLAVDAAGAPTVDPASVAAILPESLVGSLGGLLVELLAGVAVGGRETGAAASGRGAFVLAFDPARAGGARAAEDTARLAADWRAAGGHLPSRFDALGDSDETGDTGGDAAPGTVPATVSLPAAHLATLRDLARSHGEATR